ncbi:hypothetical protein QUF99_02525 [Bacillus sp. DX4.1]|uniref:hypothetical protein n=1 Tax=Bacillus sp. DX4.1 TaxID=3055867 RepID=UPI0025A22F3E|nr:hypothetical protein [Bacillus sp. DX4.1]MDM5186325.1 hypothetical protein [Bacillus sp. DX4.1]
MNLKGKMDFILSKRRKLDMNDDYGIEQSWNEIVETLSENESDTIEYLQGCNKDDLYWISEVFEDVSEKLQSKKYIECLRELDKKFPKLDMTKDIDIAESYIANF